MGNFKLNVTFALAAGAMLGCAEDADPQAGVLVVPFSLGNGKDCAVMGVTTVRGELDDGFLVAEAACESGELRFTNVPPDRYEVKLYGLDDDDVAIMDSLALGATSQDVLDGGNTIVVEPALTLTASPARLRLRWNLGFGTCDSMFIDAFEVTAWRADGSQLLMQAELPCTTEGEGAAQYRTLEDLERRLNGEELGEVSVQPLDMNGAALGDPVQFAFETPGAGRTVSLSVSCDAGGCDGSGEKD